MWYHVAMPKPRLAFETEIFRLALLTGLPGALATLGLVWFGDYSAKLRWTLGVVVVVAWLGFALALRERVVRPLQTISNLLAAIREGDYSIRARGAGMHDAYGELASEVNSLADLLQGQRVRSLEATALLARILEVMHTPLYAFDREDVLQLVNDAGVQLLGLPHARCFGRTARELGLEDLLSAPDHTVHSFGNSSARWLLSEARPTCG